MFAHRVHFGDVGAAGQQRPIDRLFVIQGQPWRGGGEEGGGAARHQADHQILVRQALNPFQQSPCPAFTVGVGNGMRGLNDLDMAGWDGMVIAGNDGAFQRHIRPGVFKRRGHDGGGFATAHDDASARCWLWRQVRRQHAPRVSGGDRRIEQTAQCRPRA